MTDEELFEKAKTLEGELRSSFLAENAASESQLLRVGGLLEANDRQDSLLDLPSTEEVQQAPETNQTIGNYKLLQKIGEGGMGSVFMAEQLRPVKRLVALKVVKAGMDSKQVVARFEAERQSLAMMDHPNIAKVLDAGSTERGEPYFVMELVKGVPISKYCDDNRLSTEQRVRLMMDVCSAIQHAHQKGIIHRDLKPSNILVAQYDDRPVPKVIDFGVAKATHQKLTEKTLYTQLGQIVGTLEYMSPEQAVLNQLDVDTRTDVYSLGVILYELLVGETPLNGKELRSQGLEQILRTIREQEPPRPSLRLSSQGEAATQTAAYQKTDQSSLSRTLRGDLDWIVMKALEKDRSRRYESASRLSEDLNNYLTGDSVEARPPTIGYRLAKAWKRNRVALASSATVVLALSLGLFGMWSRQATLNESLRILGEKNEELDASKRQLDNSLSNLQVTNQALKEKERQNEEALSWVHDYCMLLALSGNPDDAARAIEIAEQTNEPRTWVLALRGAVESNKDNDLRAIEFYEEGLKIDGEDPVLNGLVAISYGKAGDFKKYFAMTDHLKSLSENASPEQAVYLAWGMIAEPEAALSVINSALAIRETPLAVLTYGDIVSHVCMNRTDKTLLPDAIDRLEQTKRFSSAGSQYYWIGLKLRHIALLEGLAEDNAEKYQQEAFDFIRRLDAMASSPFVAAQKAFFLYHFAANEEDQDAAWNSLLERKDAGGWQTYPARIQILRSDREDVAENALRIAEALNGNPDTMARIWRAICLHRAGGKHAQEAEEIYATLKKSRSDIELQSYLYFLEHVGPLSRLQDECREYLDSPEPPPEFTRLKAEFCANPDRTNRDRLIDAGGPSVRRASALGTIARVRMLEAEEAKSKGDSAEWKRKRQEAFETFQETVDLRFFPGGDYYLAKETLKKWESE